MSEMNQPKRLVGALVSGVVYLDEQGDVQDVHWCLTADGPAPDIQPVIRTGDLNGAAELLPAMLEELADRFAQAAAVEAAKAVKSKKKAAPAVQPAPAPAASEPETGDAEPADDNGEDESEPDEAEEADQEQTEPEIAEALSEAVSSHIPAAAAPPVGKPASKKTARPAPAMTSLFDGLDLS